MNEYGYFGIGFGIGILAGGIASYFIVKKKMQEYADAEIDAYREYSKKKIEDLKEDLNKEPEKEEKPTSGRYKFRTLEDRGETIADAYNTAFSKEKKGDEDNMADEAKIAKLVNKMEKQIREDHPGIEEIKEDVYGLEDDFDTVSLDYFFEDDELYFGFGTDNEELAEEFYNKSREDLISEYWKWAPDYVEDDEEGVGSFYVRNENMKIDFEVIVHMEVKED